MWQLARDGRHVLVNAMGRIIGRIIVSDGEFKASTMVFDEQGVGTREGLGAYFTLEQAQAAVEARGHEIR